MQQRIRLDSSAIESIRYDEKKQTLDVEFREGNSRRSVRRHAATDTPERVREQPTVAPVRLLKQFHTSEILLREW